MGRRRNTAELFWQHVAIGEPDECWMWQGVVTKDYGQFRMNVTRWPAHRLAYTLAKGPIPVGKKVCHSCDIPLCMNPNHLWLGTVLENNQDRARKGRNAPMSPKCTNAKLSADDVRTIRGLIADGLTNKIIGDQYPVGVDMISAIRHNRYWKSVA